MREGDAPAEPDGALKEISENIEYRARSVEGRMKRGNRVTTTAEGTLESDRAQYLPSSFTEAAGQYILQHLIWRAPVGVQVQIIPARSAPGPTL
jgi:hypothetical protein